MFAEAGPMMKRRGARRLALEALYESEIGDVVPDTVLRRSVASRGYEFATELVNGVVAHREEIDEVIGRYSEEWSIGRMPVIDRNVLRLAVFELLYLSDIPMAVTINEAVELAKVFSTEDSGRFVNGVLSAIAEKEHLRS